MSRRYPVITGLGVVSPLGTGRQAFAAALLDGRSGLRPREAAPDDPLPVYVEAPAQGFHPRQMPGQRKNLKFMSRSVRLGMGAAFAALEDAGVAPSEVPAHRFGAYVGAGLAGGAGRDLEPALRASMTDGELDLVAFARDGLPEVNPLWLLKGLANNVLGFISAHFDMKGPNLNICNSGVSGLQAIGEAAQAIRDDRAEVCLAGGYDSLLEPSILALYARLGLLSASRDPALAGRPYHEERDGFVPGEGGAFVVVEELEHAQARGARIWGHVLGYGSADGAYDLAGPEPNGRGILGAASRALREAGVPPVDVGVVVAHASGSRQYDAVEARAIARLLGPARDRVPVTAPKSMLGHTVAASGVFGAVALLSALHERRLPATTRLDHVGGDCPLRHVTEPGEPYTRAPHGLVLSAGLGGQHAALYLGEDPY